MFNRQEAKSRAKVSMRANYWKTVLVAFVLFAIIGSGAATFNSSASAGIGNYEAKYDVEFEDENPSKLEVFIDSLGRGLFFALFFAILSVLVFGSLFAFALDIFVFNPLEVGCRKFMLDNTEVPAGLMNLLYGFDHDYMRNVKAIFRRDLYLFLWSLLFIIPGIVKHYSYLCVPYLIIEHPEMNGKQAIEESRRMMNGHKMEAFILDLSFILWLFASALTLGIVGVLYVNPYMAGAHAEFYKQIKFEG